jgi:hypothetical protein
MKRSIGLAAVLLISFALAGVCAAQETAQFVAKADATSKPGVVVGSVVSLKATVEAVNAETREVTLKDDEGNTRVVVCGPEVRNFAQINVGDVVSAQYGQSVALYIKEEAGEMDSKQADMLERAPLGAKPAATEVQVREVQAAVDYINYDTRLISLKGTDGKELSFIAGDEVKRFNEVKKGDQVTFDYTEGVAIDVQKSTEAPKMIETQSISREPGKKPAGTFETVGFLTARVEEIDYTTRVVKLGLPEGQTLRITAGDQVKRLNEVHKGDEVVVQYMQKLSIKVTSPKSK